MGWTISVGRAGAAKGSEATQAMRMRFDEPGVALRLSVGEKEADAGAVPAWQARRVWQKVLATVVDAD
jgi:hypothetical protein